MITTVFVDITGGKYVEIATFSYNIQGIKKDFLDFSSYNPFSDDDIFEVINIIHLPNEAKKIVEVRQTHTDSFKRERTDGYTVKE